MDFEESIFSSAVLEILWALIDKFSGQSPSPKILTSVPRLIIFCSTKDSGETILSIAYSESLDKLMGK